MLSAVNPVAGEARGSDAWYGWIADSISDTADAISSTVDSVNDAVVDALVSADEALDGAIFQSDAVNAALDYTAPLSDSIATNIDSAITGLETFSTTAAQLLTAMQQASSQSEEWLENLVISSLISIEHTIADSSVVVFIYTGMWNPDPEVIAAAYQVLGPYYVDNAGLTHYGLQGINHPLAAAADDALTAIEGPMLSAYVAENAPVFQDGVAYLPGDVDAESSGLTAGPLVPPFQFIPWNQWVALQIGSNFEYVQQTVEFGNAMHEQFPDWFEEEYELEPGQFDPFVAPGLTGPDIEVTDPAAIEQLGFNQADLKPASPTGILKFEEQQERWGPTQMFGYDQDGNIYEWDGSQFNLLP